MEIESKNNYKIPIKEFKPNKIEKIIGADHRMKKDGELEKAINIAVKYIKGK